jgi:hypothetical protein
MPSQRSRTGAFAIIEERRFPHCGTDDLRSVAAGTQTNDCPMGQAQVYSVGGSEFSSETTVTAVRPTYCVCVWGNVLVLKDCTSRQMSRLLPANSVTRNVAACCSGRSRL